MTDGEQIIQGMKEAIASTDLKPCPFCGGEAGFSLQKFVVICKKCGGRRPTGALTSGEAITAWNTRTPDTDRVASLEAVLTAMVDAEVDYMTINNLGDPEQQHNIKWARRVLANTIDEPPKE